MLMDSISRRLFLPEVAASSGDTPTNEWLYPVFNRLFGHDPSLATGQRTKYDSLRAIVVSLGGEYDATIHSSEAQDAKSNRRTGNITAEGLEYIRDLLALPGAFDPEDHQRPPGRTSTGTIDPFQAGLERQRRTAEVVYRPGASTFKQRIREAYGFHCAVSGYDAVDGLQAAHIIRYSGPGSDTTENGILLRADIHALYDRHLIAFSDDYRVLLHQELQGTRYATYGGRSINLPSDSFDWPAPDGLREQRRLCGL